MYQKTLRAPCHIHGIGLHTGKKAHFILQPAPVDNGIVFRLISQGRQIEFPADVKSVVNTTRNTTVGRDGLEVCTVEHLLAALSGLGIDNAYIETGGPEIPAMDGSAQPFVSRIMEVGRLLQPAPRHYLKVNEPVVIEDGNKIAGLYPSHTPKFSFMIDFENPAIQTQSLGVFLSPQTFVAQLAKARTFGFVEDMEELQRNGLALGGSLDNAVGLDSEGNVLNPAGLRYSDEFVRHKILDAVGDLSLSGYPILAEYRGIRSGHRLNIRLVEELARHPGRWELVSAVAEAQAV